MIETNFKIKIRYKADHEKLSHKEYGSKSLLFFNVIIDIIFNIHICKILSIIIISTFNTNKCT